ncbi:ABC transporter ATP-binding protein [Paenibacillus xylanexedens]|uniref:ABC transporter ATP-binding protein n=1 Tax=Paenibacillus xylanexedens TaxID=528191 RepID=UPI003B01CB4D
MSTAQIQEKPLKQEYPHPFKVYLWVLSFIKPYYGITILLILMGVTISGCELMIPKIIQYFIDIAYPTGNHQIFINLFMMLLLVIVIVILSTMAQNLLQRILSEKTARDLRLAAFRKTRDLGIPYFESMPPGQILSLLNNEVSALQEIYKTYMPISIQFGIYSVLSISIMLSINVKLTLIMIPVFVLYYLVGPYFARRAVLYGKQAADYSIELNKQIYDSVSALQEIRANGSQDWDMERHQNSVQSYLKVYLKTHLFSFLRGSVRRFCNNLGAIGIFAYGSVLAKTGELTVGEFVVFVLIYFYTIFVLTKIVSLATEQRQLLFQGGKLYTLLNSESAIIEKKDPTLLRNIRGDLSFKQVQFAYSKDKPILKNFTIDIRAGEKVILVGSSGCGKSTIVKLVARFYEPLSGSLTLDGVPIKDLSLKQLRETIGCVFQETYLFGKSIRDNIAFGNPHASDEDIVEAAKAAYAHKFIMELENGYNTLVGERGIKLSGGQRQRIAIARMFVKSPSIILLDEATSALDNISERDVQEALNQLMKGRTTVIISHRLTAIRNADRIVVLDEGEIRESGTYEQVIGMRGKFHQLVNGKVLK